MFYLINLLNVKVSNETTKLYIDLCFITFFKFNPVYEEIVFSFFYQFILHHLYWGLSFIQEVRIRLRCENVFFIWIKHKFSQEGGREAVIINRRCYIKHSKRKNANIPSCHKIEPFCLKIIEQTEKKHKALGDNKLLTLNSFC